MPPTLPPFLAYALAIAGIYKYPLVFLGTLFEGPIVMIACGFLLRFGVFEIAAIYAVLVIGDITADIGWYYIGRYLVEPFLRRHGHFMSVTPELFNKAKNLFNRYHVKILVISKLTLGFGMAIVTLMAAGATRVPIKTYLTLNIIGEFILVAMLMTVGYFFGELYGYIENGFKDAFIVGAGIIAIIITYGFARYMKSKIL